MDKPILEIKGLKTHFFTYNGVVRAVDGIDLAVNRNEVVGIVGETGCGKSVTVRSTMGLVPDPGQIVAGRVLLDGENLLEKRDAELRRIRGSRMSMIFQNPLSSLNPVFTIGNQVGHVISIHQAKNIKEALDRAVEVFDLVRLPDPERLLQKYPHELSGGMLQRVMIAMALSCRPEVLIADEPTTALDVTIQAQILSLMLRLKEETGTSIIMITHDLGVVAETCDRVAVMYAGLIVERGPAQAIFSNPLHPYTEGLLSSLPGQQEAGDELRTIEGLVPDLIHPPSGCRFHARCPIAEEVCERQIPELIDKGDGRAVACHFR
ncbi:Oligopeptide ABC transporter, ATP-binding protein OppD (TC 3.A.1.5.1) [Olavius sp. associated proteobacterium Delta 1]|nr:Oligopeptide ABC transporter, ATP-binding protein OppD (TC 3.A.1.5.1) [Olavius sp. associated proteobacterium Delta 1]